MDETTNIKPLRTLHRILADGLYEKVRMKDLREGYEFSFDDSPSTVFIAVSGPYAMGEYPFVGIHAILKAGG